MDEYSVVKEHTANNLTLLCGYHHDLKTRNQLPTRVVRAHNAAPHNKPQGKTATHPLFYFGDTAQIVAGGNRISIANHSGSALKIDDHSLVDFELVDGNLMLNIDLRDEDGSPVLAVRRNELVHSTHLWDYEYTGQRLSIREKKGHIYLKIAFQTETQRVVLEKGLVSHNGVDLLIDPNGLCILNNCTFLDGNSVKDSDTAISIGEAGTSNGPAAFRIEIYRGPYDRKEAIKWARKQMKLAEDRRPMPPSNSHPTILRSGQSLTWMSIALLPYPSARLSCGRTL